MSTDDNKALMGRATEEGWNQGKLAVFDELAAPDVVYQNPDRPDVRTREDYKRMVTDMRSAFHDLHVTIEDMIAEGDKVVMCTTLRGTNTGDFVTPMHIPATGKHVTLTGITIVRTASGKVVEIWDQGDDLGLLQQLGLIPVPEPVG